MFGLPGMGMPGMNQMPQEELEPENDEGIPLPPGFTTHVTNYGSKSGLAKIHEIKDNTASTMATFNPPSLFMTAFAIFSATMFLAFRVVMDMSHQALNRINQAFTSKIDFTPAQRMKIFGSGIICLIIMIVVLFRTSVKSGPLLSSNEAFTSVFNYIETE